MEPTSTDLFQAMDDTWSAAEYRDLPPFVLRHSAGGGQRVNAATLLGEFEPYDITAAEKVMVAQKNTPLFRLSRADSRLDRVLMERGYKLVDPTVIFLAKITDLEIVEPAPLAAISCRSPLALMEEIWKQGGISNGRVRVMHQTKDPKSYVLARHADQPAGCAFIACAENIAMLHALEIAPGKRKLGCAQSILHHCAIWARDHGAQYLSALTTRENTPAQKLFSGFGMQIAEEYHYRKK